MNAVQFFTDEDVYGSVAVALRAAGFNALSTPEADRLGESDDSQIEWTASQGRVLVTFNVAHFARLHGQWLRQGKHHAGIVVGAQRPIGDTLRRLLHLAEQLDADAMRDRLEFLSNW